jgi:hypothetical protein
MRLIPTIAAAAIVAGTLVAANTPALAYENFIPLGHNYSPDQSELPQLNSEQDRINAQTDIYEAEIYTRQRDAKEFNSRVQQFRNQQEFTMNNGFIDY